MSRKFSPHFLLSVIASLSILTFSAPAFAQKPPKGGGTTLPPVRYQVQLWAVPGALSLDEVQDMNSQGQTVGSFNYDGNGDGAADARRAFLYDPNSNLEQGVDLNTVVNGIPDGWVIRKATSINDVGQIAAYMYPTATAWGQAPEEVRAVMIEWNQAPPTLYEIPDRNITSSSLASDINDWGDLVVRYSREDGTYGHYLYNFDPLSGLEEPLDLGVSTAMGHLPKVNNERTVVGQIGNGDAYRFIWNGSQEFFSGLTVRSINESGAFCGSASILSRGGKTTNQAFVFDTALELYSTNGPWDLNESKDFAGNSTLYHRNFGVLTIKNLLDPSDPDTSVATGSFLYVYTLSNRDSATNFPVLAGLSGTGGILLVPIPVP
ncbi:MAG: hypothetical protein JNL58_29230 [Planctomyces sp.]|nr:hypothetical protein [Planctomyces sp.]